MVEDVWRRQAVRRLLMKLLPSTRYSQCSEAAERAMCTYSLATGPTCFLTTKRQCCTVTISRTINNHEGKPARGLPFSAKQVSDEVFKVASIRRPDELMKLNSMKLKSRSCDRPALVCYPTSAKEAVARESEKVV